PYWNAAKISTNLYMRCNREAGLLPQRQTSLGLCVKGPGAVWGRGPVTLDTVWALNEGETPYLQEDGQK
ncbi:hypothetical protein HGM15179_009420, partial [Zosterops borbonicus]